MLDKYHVKLGLECPFHPDREIFAPQQTDKQQDRPSQWTCRRCGKSFYEEKFLDLHFGNRHRERINTAEDAVCLSNYCDVMRCDVLAAFESTLFGSRATTTDIEVWNEKTAVATTTTTRTTKRSHRSKADTTTRSGSSSNSLNNKSQSSDKRFKGGGGKGAETCDRSRHRNRKSDDDEEDEEEDEEGDASTVESSCGADTVTKKSNQEESGNEDNQTSPPLDQKQQKVVEMQRLKANCKKEELDKLRTKCQIVIRNCIEGLLVNMSTQEFKQMEGGR